MESSNTPQTMPEEWEKRFDAEKLWSFTEENGVELVEERVKQFIRQERALAKSQERARVIQVLKNDPLRKAVPADADEKTFDYGWDCAIKAIESLQKEGE